MSTAQLDDKRPSLPGIGSLLNLVDQDKQAATQFASLAQLQSSVSTTAGRFSTIDGFDSFSLSSPSSSASTNLDGGRSSRFSSLGSFSSSSRAPSPTIAHPSSLSSAAAVDSSETSGAMLWTNRGGILPSMSSASSTALLSTSPSSMGAGLLPSSFSGRSPAGAATTTSIMFDPGYAPRVGGIAPPSSSGSASSTTVTARSSSSLPRPSSSAAAATTPMCTTATLASTYPYATATNVSPTRRESLPPLGLSSSYPGPLRHQQPPRFSLPTSVPLTTAASSSPSPPSVPSQNPSPPPQVLQHQMQQRASTTALLPPPSPPAPAGVMLSSGNLTSTTSRRGGGSPIRPSTAPWTMGAGSGIGGSGVGLPAFGEQRLPAPTAPTPLTLLVPRRGSAGGEFEDVLFRYAAASASGPPPPGCAAGPAGDEARRRSHPVPTSVGWLHHHPYAYPHHQTPPYSIGHGKPPTLPLLHPREAEHQWRQGDWIRRNSLPTSQYSRLAIHQTQYHHPHHHQQTGQQQQPRAAMMGPPPPHDGRRQSDPSAQESMTGVMGSGGGKAFPSVPPPPPSQGYEPVVGSSSSVGTSSKYHCPYCGKKFNRPSSLRIHTYSHTGEKPFACSHPTCGRRFSVQSNLKRHARTHSASSTSSPSSHPHFHHPASFPASTAGDSEEGGSSEGNDDGDEPMDEDE